MHTVRTMCIGVHRGANKQYYLKRTRFTWQQRKANDELRIQIQHCRLQGERSKVKFLEAKLRKKKVKSILANECKIEDTFSQISADTLE